MSKLTDLFPNTNNCIVDGMFIIRDTKTNRVMTGGNGQYMFDSESTPKKSARHTAWFPQWQKYEFLRSTGHGLLVDQYEEVYTELLHMRENDEDTGYGTPIRKHLSKLASDIDNVLGGSSWQLSNSSNKSAAEFAKKNTFAKQTRFVVEKVVHLVSEPIPKKGK